MCKAGGGLERDILVAQLTTLVNEWDKLIHVSSTDEHEEGHKHGIALCRNHVARLIDLELISLDRDHS